jgi:hypothetical protein
MKPEYLKPPAFPTRQNQGVESGLLPEKEFDFLDPYFLSGVDKDGSKP